MFEHVQKANFQDSFWVKSTTHATYSSLDFFFSLSLLPSSFAFLASFFSFVGAVYKIETGQRDGGIGMHVWGLENWGRETRDLRTSRMGRRDVWDGDAGKRNTRKRDVNNYCKS